MMGRLSNPKSGKRLSLWIQDLSYLLRVHRLVLEGDRIGATIWIALLLFQSSTPVVQIWTTRYIANALLNSDTQGAVVGASLSAALVVGVGLTLPLQATIASRIQDRGVANVEQAIIAAGNALEDLVRVSSPEYRDQVEAVKQGAMEFGMAITRANRVYGSVISLIGILVSLATFNPLMPLILIATGMLAHRFSSRQAELLYQAGWDLAKTGNEMRYAREVATTPASAAETRMFEAGPWWRLRYTKLSQEFLAEMRIVRLRGALWAAGGEAIHVSALAGSFWYVAWRVEHSSLSVGDLAMFIYALIQAQFTTRDVFVAADNLRMLIVRARRFFPFIDGAGPEISIPEPLAGLDPASTSITGLTLEGVSFHYQNGVEDVLKDVSLSLPIGKVTALVGENGAGKSTLVSLLTRMYDPVEGRIALGETDFSQFDLAKLRRITTAVFQSSGRFAFTLQDNIAIGDPMFSWHDPDEARARARAVAARYGIDRIAASLPSGYETELTRTFESSVDLSGGQWQLVGFARGLLRSDALVAMLDEPSSALDPEREREQIEHIRRYAHEEQRSVLLISHRLSTVRWVDAIAVMNKGMVIEYGTHSELIAQHGVYAELFQMQASRYEDKRKEESDA